jgi:hypothetical protein
MIASKLALLSGLWGLYYTMSLAERGGQLSKPFDDFSLKNTIKIEAIWLPNPFHG